MSELSVRRLRGGEGATWRQAVAAVISPADRDNELISEADADNALQDERCYMLVAEVESSPAGLLSAYRFPDLEAGGQIAYLYDIEVLADYRNTGIGYQLLQALLALCDRDEVDLLWAGTEASNLSARALFEKTGATLEGDSYTEYEWEMD